MHRRSVHQGQPQEPPEYDEEESDYEEYDDKDEIDGGLSSIPTSVIYLVSMGAVFSILVAVLIQYGGKSSPRLYDTVPPLLGAEHDWQLQDLHDRQRGVDQQLENAVERMQKQDKRILAVINSQDALQVLSEQSARRMDTFDAELQRLENLFVEQLDDRPTKSEVMDLVSPMMAMLKTEIFETFSQMVHSDIEEVRSHVDASITDMKKSISSRIDRKFTQEFTQFNESRTNLEQRFAKISAQMQVYLVESRSNDSPTIHPDVFERIAQLEIRLEDISKTTGKPDADLDYRLEEVDSRLEDLSKIVAGIGQSDRKVTHRFESIESQLRQIIVDVQVGLRPNENVVAHVKALDLVLQEVQTNSSRALKPNQQLLERINVLDRRIELMMEDIESSKPDHRMTERLDALGSRIVDVRSELMRPQEKFEADLTELRQLVTDLSKIGGDPHPTVVKRLSNFEKNVEEVQSDMTAVGSQLNSVYEKLANFQATVPEDVAEQISGIHERISKLSEPPTNGVDLIEERLAAVQMRLGAQLNETADRILEQTVSKSEMEDLNNNMAAVDVMREEIETLQTDIKAVSNNAKETGEKIALVRSEVGEARSDVVELKEEVVQAAKNSSVALEGLAILRENVADVQKQANIATDQVAAAIKGASQAAKSVQNVDGTNPVSVDIEEIQSQINAVEAQVGTVETKVGIVAQELEDVGSKIATMETQVEEIPVIKSDLGVIRTDVNHLQDDVTKALAKDDEGEKLNWASSSLGASIEDERTVTGLKRDKASLLLQMVSRAANEVLPGLKTLGQGVSEPPEVILDSDMTPGRCFAFPIEGDITIKFADTMKKIRAFEIIHLPAPLRLHNSLPRKFTVSARHPDPQSAQSVVGQFEFRQEASTEMYTIDVPNVSHLTFRFLSNWGADFTCLYQIRVYGDP